GSNPFDNIQSSSTTTSDYNPFDEFLNTKSNGNQKPFGDDEFSNLSAQSTNPSVNNFGNTNFNTTTSTVQNTQPQKDQFSDLLSSFGGLSVAPTTSQKVPTTLPPKPPSISPRNTTTTTNQKSDSLFDQILSQPKLK